MSLFLCPICRQPLAREAARYLTSEDMKARLSACLIYAYANLSIGQITPPIGMNLFVSSSICEVRLEKVIRQVLPFLAVLIVDLFLFTYIPGIVTVLPNALLH